MLEAPDMTGEGTKSSLVWISLSPSMLSSLLPPPSSECSEDCSSPLPPIFLSSIHAKKFSMIKWTRSHLGSPSKPIKFSRLSIISSSDVWEEFSEVLICVVRVDEFRFLGPSIWTPLLNTWGTETAWTPTSYCLDLRGVWEARVIFLKLDPCWHLKFLVLGEDWIPISLEMFGTSVSSPFNSWYIFVNSSVLWTISRWSHDWFDWVLLHELRLELRPEDELRDLLLDNEGVRLDLLRDLEWVRLDLLLDLERGRLDLLRDRERLLLSLKLWTGDLRGESAPEDIAYSGVWTCLCLSTTESK